MTAPSERLAPSAGIDRIVDGLRELGEQCSSADIMQLTTRAAVASFASAAASLTVPIGERFTTVAPTSDLPVAVDALQYRHGGPCIDALRTDDTVVSTDDLRGERRWQQFAAAALANTQVLSTVSFRLYLDQDEPIGSLNLYAEMPYAFDPDTVRDGERFAAHVAVVLAYTKERERSRNLVQALESNRDIGAAIGILMSRHMVTRDQAFDLLRVTSQCGHRKLRDIAGDVLLTGDLPPLLPSRPSAPPR